MAFQSEPSAKAASSGCFSPMVRPFPEPSPKVRSGLKQLRRHEQDLPSDSNVLDDVDELPRPWDPASCTPDLQSEIWLWLEAVASWINDQHLWSVTRQGIPECWPDHPHVIHDLAVVACARYYASLTANPSALETWHREILPGFLHRLADRLGDSCQPGEHAPPPRREREGAYARRRHQRDLRFGTHAQSVSETATKR